MKHTSKVPRSDRECMMAGAELLRRGRGGRCVCWYIHTHSDKRIGEQATKQEEHVTREINNHQSKSNFGRARAVRLKIVSLVQSGGIDKEPNSVRSLIHAL